MKSCFLAVTVYPAIMQSIHSFYCYVFVYIDTKIYVETVSNCLHVYIDQLSSAFRDSNQSSSDASRKDVALYSSKYRQVKMYLNYAVTWPSSNPVLYAMYRKLYVFMLKLRLLCGDVKVAKSHHL